MTLTKCNLHNVIENRKASRALDLDLLLDKEALNSLKTFMGDAYTYTYLDQF